MTPEELLAETRRIRGEQLAAEAHAAAMEDPENTFGSQFKKGLVHTGSLGYAGSGMPEDLPLTGVAGRLAGDFTGFIPAAVAGSLLPEVAGSALAGELLSGAIYGAVSKPELGPDGQSESRIDNALKTAALFGAGHLVFKGFGALGRFAGFGAKEALPAIEKELAGPAAEAVSKAIPQPPLAPYEGMGGMPELPSGVPPPPGNKPAGPGEGFGGMPEVPGPESLQKVKDWKILRDRALKVPSEFSPPPASGLLEFLAKPEESSPLSPFFKELDNPLGDNELAMATITHSNKTPTKNTLADSLIPEELHKTDVTATIGTLNKLKAVGQHDIEKLPWEMNYNSIIKPEEKYFAEATRLAGEDLAAGTVDMWEKSIKHNLGETPPTAPAIDSVVPPLEEQIALQSTLKELADKNTLGDPTLQANSLTEQPINHLMSQGVNYEDAKATVEASQRRAETNITNDIHSMLEGIKYEGVNTPRELPAWEIVKGHKYTPDQAVDLFKNVGFGASGGLRAGLLKHSRYSGQDAEFQLTEKGYAWLRQYNPEGLTGAKPDFISEKGLGAIRAKGLSPHTFTADELKKDLQFKMKPNIILARGWVEQALDKAGKEIPDSYQLTEAGSNFLTGAPGTSANVGLRQFDIMSKFRVLPYEKDAIEELTKMNERDRLLLTDVVEETQGFRKGCKPNGE